MKCSKCETRLACTAKFCGHCGLKQDVQKNLILAAIDQDQLAYTELFKQAEHTVKLTVYSIMNPNGRNSADADDVILDSMMKGFRSLDQLKDANRFLPWMRTIARNKAVDYLRKNKELNFSDLSTDEMDFEDTLEDTDFSNRPDMVMDQQAKGDLLKDILSDIPAEQRTVLVMYYYNDMKIPEIARELGCTEATVKSRLKYGKSKVKTGVNELQQKHGIKLYSAAPIVVLYWLFRDSEAAYACSTGMLEQVLQNTGISSLAHASSVTEYAANSTAINTTPVSSTAKATATVAKSEATSNVATATGTQAGATSNVATATGTQAGVTSNTAIATGTQAGVTSNAATATGTQAGISSNAVASKAVASGWVQAGGASKIAATTAVTAAKGVSVKLVAGIIAASVVATSGVGYGVYTLVNRNAESADVATNVTTDVTTDEADSSADLDFEIDNEDSSVDTTVDSDADASADSDADTSVDSDADTSADSDEIVVIPADLTEEDRNIIAFQYENLCNGSCTRTKYEEEMREVFGVTVEQALQITEEVGIENLYNVDRVETVEEFYAALAGVSLDGVNTMPDSNGIEFDRKYGDGVDSEIIIEKDVDHYRVEILMFKSDLENQYGGFFVGSFEGDELWITSTYGPYDQCAKVVKTDQGVTVTFTDAHGDTRLTEGLAYNFSSK